MGFALYLAQRGIVHARAKRLKGSLRGLMEAIADNESGTYRIVYAAWLGDAIYVLHAFQKKSTRGIATSKRDLNLIKDRLKWAQGLGKNA